MKKLNLNAIRIDGGTQSRVEINMEAVADYAEAVKVGIEFPAVVVFHDGANHWLADGFHRFHAHKQAGKASIQADVREGTLLDAKLFALGANGTHGLRRGNADKRKAVQMAFDEPSWADWSDRKVAEACGVSHTFVANLRRPPVATVATPKPQAPASEVATVATLTPKKELLKSAPKRSISPDSEGIPELTDADELAEARDTLAQIAQENEVLRDRLAVESMDVSEEEKTQASETIAELREQVRVLGIELDAVKASRDSYMRENAELKKQCQSQRRELDKMRKVAA